MANEKKSGSEDPKSSSRKMDPVVHFEMPYMDRNRMAGFYEKAFGWKTNMLGEEFGYYAVTMTSEEGEDGTPAKKGMINGGFFKKDENKPDQIPSVVIAVENLKEAMAKVEKAGGVVLGEPMEIPDTGSYVSFVDTEGNRVSMMEPIMKNS